MTPAKAEPTASAAASSTAPKLRIERRLTSTPLARHHEHALRAKGPRDRKALPWASFDRSKYPEGALPASAANAQRAPRAR